MTQTQEQLLIESVLEAEKALMHAQEGDSRTTIAYYLNHILAKLATIYSIYRKDDPDIAPLYIKTAAVYYDSEVSRAEIVELETYGEPAEFLDTQTGEILDTAEALHRS